MLNARSISSLLFLLSVNPSANASIMVMVDTPILNVEVIILSKNLASKGEHFPRIPLKDLNFVS